MLLLILGFLVLYPLALLLLNSFQLARPGAAPVWGLRGWQQAFTQPGIRAAVFNTLSLTAVQVVISTVAAVGAAWLIARTDVPTRNSLECGFWIAYFLPTLPVVLAWILLLDPQFGLVNTALVNALGLRSGPFNIYSWWGIVFAHMMTYSIAIKVMLLVPVFRNMDRTLEEAAQVTGASRFVATSRIMLPLMAPVILVVLLMSIIRGFEAFEIELVLGLPAHIDVYSTQIYRIVRQEPPQYGPATSMGVMILLIMLPFVIAQRWATRRGVFTTITGRYRGGLVLLGAWRWPATAALSGFVLLVTVVPVTFLLMGTFMRLFGFFSLGNPWTLKHWITVLHDPLFLSSIQNTLIIGLSTALLSVALYSAVAYVIVRVRFFAAGALDFLSWLPFTLPGVLLSLGYLWMFLGLPMFRPLYGSHLVLILALMLGGITLGVQLSKTTLLQLGSELEEASRVAGGSWLLTYRRVVLPLLGPVLLTVGILSFVQTSRNVSSVVLLATSGTRPLSLLQLDYLTQGQYEAGGVAGVVVVLLTISIALLARRFGLSLGVGQERPNP
ncbi:MAG: iron ABC transporter permease [Chloroflexi bacterium]|nr:MAG: iron ABC transporter permease [Chloroflexota bacterium]